MIDYEINRKLERGENEAFCFNLSKVSCGLLLKLVSGWNWLAKGLIGGPHRTHSCVYREMSKAYMKVIYVRYFLKLCACFQKAKTLPISQNVVCTLPRLAHAKVFPLH